MFGTGKVSGSVDARTNVKTWPPGAGEMAARIRAHDWAATPLGPIEGWPRSLKTVVDLLLAQAFPMAALWGAENI